MSLLYTKKTTMMMAAAAPPAETASKTNVFSAAKLNRSIIQDQHLSDTSIIDPLQNIIFKNGCFNDVCFKTGGQNIQFQECSLKNCQFFGEWSFLCFIDSTLDDVNFKYVDISHLRILSGHTSIVTFQNAKLEHVKLDSIGLKNKLATQCVLAVYASKLETVELHNSNIQLLVQSTALVDASIMDTQLTGALQHCSLKNTTFKHISAKKLKVTHNTFCNVCFTSCVFPQGIFSKSKFTHCDVACSKFNNASFVACVFNHCDFVASCFKNADFTTATLYYARLTDCDFQAATLVFGDWKNVILESVSLDRVNWAETKLVNISRNANSKLLGRLFFGKKHPEKVKFTLRLFFKGGKSARMRTPQLLTNDTNDLFLKIKIPADYEAEVDFVHIAVERLGLWNRLFEPYSAQPLTADVFFDYLQIGRKILYYRPEPFQKTGLYGFSCIKNTSLASARKRTYSL